MILINMILILDCLLFFLIIFFFIKFFRTGKIIRIFKNERKGLSKELIKQREKYFLTKMSGRYLIWERITSLCFIVVIVINLFISSKHTTLSLVMLILTGLLLMVSLNSYKEKNIQRNKIKKIYIKNNPDNALKFIVHSDENIASFKNFMLTVNILGILLILLCISGIIGIYYK